MKNYFRIIIRNFTSFPQDESTTQEVHKWLIDPEHAAEKEVALNDLWAETENLPNINIRSSLDAVYNKVGITVTQKKSPYFLTMTRYIAAIALLTIIVTTTYMVTKAEYSKIAMVENYTNAGEMQYIELPDGSKVQTNSETLLLYPDKFTGDTRTVFLVGEANFKVKANPKKPFIVRSSTISITALGTEFNVLAYSEQDAIVTTLLEGKVKVACGEQGESYILSPGQQVSFLKRTGKGYLSNMDTNVNDAIVWQKGVLVFRSETLKEMIYTLQRKYNVTIQYKSNHFNDDKYNFRFFEDASLQEVLDIMKGVIGDFEYSIERDSCTIK